MSDHYQGASFEVGREQFQSLNDVVEHYAAAPVYKSTMLTQVAPDIRVSSQNQHFQSYQSFGNFHYNITDPFIISAHKPCGYRGVTCSHL